MNITVQLHWFNTRVDAEAREIPLCFAKKNFISTLTLWQNCENTCPVVLLL